MNLHIYDFTSNKSAKWTDFVEDIQMGIDSKGIGHIHLHTKEKYVDIDARGYRSTPDGVKGSTIDIKPVLYVETENGYEDPLEMYTKTSDTKWLDVYYDHPDYYCIEFILEDDKFDNFLVVALKHQYSITCLNHDDTYGYDCLVDMKTVDNQETGYNVYERED